MADSPPGPEPHGASRVAVIHRDQGSHCHQMVGVGRMPQTEDEGDAQSYEEGRAVKKAGQRAGGALLAQVAGKLGLIRALSLRLKG